MQIYDIANVFYLPAASSLGFKEGFARLDHLQAVPLSLGSPSTEGSSSATTRWPHSSSG